MTLTCSSFTARKYVPLILLLSCWFVFCLDHLRYSYDADGGDIHDHICSFDLRFWLLFSYQQLKSIYTFIFTYNLKIITLNILYKYIMMKKFGYLSYYINIEYIIYIYTHIYFSWFRNIDKPWFWFVFSLRPHQFDL